MGKSKKSGSVAVNKTPTAPKGKTNRSRLLDKEIYKTTYMKTNTTKTVDEYITPKMLQTELSKFAKGNVKFYFNYQVKLKNDDSYFKGYFTSSVFNYNRQNKNINNLLISIKKDLDKTMEHHYKGTKSGVQYLGLLSLIIKTNEYYLLKGRGFTPLPAYISNKKACINIQNNDDMCFKYCIYAFLHPVEMNVSRVSNYNKYDYLRFNEGDFPFALDADKIEEFENNNQEFLKGYKINVFVYEENETENIIQPFIISKRIKDNKAISLLYINDHYVYIKDLGKLMASQISNHQKKTFICNHCLSYATYRERMFEIHKRDCQGFAKKLQIQQYKKGTISFENIKHFGKIPYVIYADFECIIKENDLTEEEKSQNTVKEHTHVPCGFMFLVVDIHGKEFYKALYRGNDDINTMIHFFNELQTIEGKILEKYANHPYPEPLLTYYEELDFGKATNCCYCNVEFYKPREKVRDHDHFTGLYRGAACRSCNSILTINQKTPINCFFHNGNRYDSHIIINYLTKLQEMKLIKDMKISSVISRNTQNFISFKLDNITFKDSYDFLSSSLAKLASNLTIEDFTLTKTLHSDTTKFNLMIKKGEYPYEYMNDFNRFGETKIPEISKFYSTLTMESLTEERYNHVKQVWSVFKIKNMGEYHDLYLQTDVYLLADIFEKFRNTSITARRIDPSHSYTLPGYSWQCFLLESKVKLPYIENSDVHLMLEKGIRGGITNAIKRRTSDNILYIDANNLYGYAMSQYLPYDNFEIALFDESIYKDKTIEQFIEILMDIKSDSDKGMILEVDIDYPIDLHDLHNDFPLLPLNRKVDQSELSEFQKKLIEKKFSPCNKLVLDLKDKKNYVIHYRMLQFAIKAGLKLRNVHRIITFNQKPFMKSYIDGNSLSRAKAKSDFEKDYYKLLNNSVYGKTCESVRSRQNIRIYDPKTQDHLVNKAIASPNFKSRTVLNNNTVFMHLTKSLVVLDKPIYIGLAVLELSKLLMYDFYYNVLKKEFNEKMHLCYIDTDSFIIQFDKDINVHKWMVENYKYFDLSNFPDNHDAFTCQEMSSEEIKKIKDENKKVVGKFKDECGGQLITDFIALKAKQYSYIVEGEEHIKAKGVNRAIIQNEIEFADFQECLDASIDLYNGNDEAYNKTLKYRTQNNLRSYDHTISSIKSEKIALNSFDDKRHITNNGIDTLAHGHYTINLPTPELGSLGKPKSVRPRKSPTTKATKAARPTRSTKAARPVTPPSPEESERHLSQKDYKYCFECKTYVKMKGFKAHLETAKHKKNKSS